MTADKSHEQPHPDRRDLDAFESALSGGLQSAIFHLNRLTPHRFTGVFRFDGEMLRSVALVDKWAPDVTRGDDLPIANAYCAHLHSTGQPLEVHDGASDPRTGWMRDAPFRSYSGAVIYAPDGSLWGALCHFDEKPCDEATSSLPLLLSAAGRLYPCAADVAA
ncbi:GAF domain-containing protein [Ramlibacter sp.]|uniref:GAF domain-containing protein n=1 Tax=Ramlibacter sp. TaxID=1917967 RepID=UPI003D0CB033